MKPIFFSVNRSFYVEKKSIIYKLNSKQYHIVDGRPAGRVIREEGELWAYNPMSYILVLFC